MVKSDSDSSPVFWMFWVVWEALAEAKTAPWSLSNLIYSSQSEETSPGQVETSEFWRCEELFLFDVTSNETSTLNIPLTRLEALLVSASILTVISAGWTCIWAAKHVTTEVRVFPTLAEFTEVSFKDDAFPTSHLWPSTATANVWPSLNPKSPLCDVVCFMKFLLRSRFRDIELKQPALKGNCPSVRLRAAVQSLCFFPVQASTLLAGTPARAPLWFSALTTCSRCHMLQMTAHI